MDSSDPKVVLRLIDDQGIGVGRWPVITGGVMLSATKEQRVVLWLLAGSRFLAVAYLAVAGLLAWVVYRKLGLALLRKAWFNFDLIWAAALVATGLVTILI
jgi:hypothetical protein